MAVVKSVRVNGIRVRYREAGAGPAVVLVHGLGEDGASWARQQEELDGYRTYAYDLRGHGESGLGAADGSLGQLREDLVGFLREVSGPAVCVGFSLGGTVVLSAAAAAPDLLRGVVALGTSTVVGRAAVEYYAERAGRARSGDPRRLAEAVREDTAAALYGAEVDVAAVAARRLAAVGEGLGYANAAAAMAGLRDRPLTPVLADITCPVAVIGAEQDALCPRKAADIMLGGLPQATYDEIPAAGHLMNVERPAEVTARLAAALRRMSTG